MSRELQSYEAYLLEETGMTRSGEGIHNWIISAIALLWALFQLSLPRFIILDSVTIRSVHLAFAMILVFLGVPFSKKHTKGIRFLHSTDKTPAIDYLIAILGAIAALYIILDWKGMGDQRKRIVELLDKMNIKHFKADKVKKMEKEQTDLFLDACCDD